MESSALSVTAAALLALSKTLNSTSSPLIYTWRSHLPAPRSSQCLRSRLVPLQLRRLFNSEFHGSKSFGSVPCLSDSLRSLCAVRGPLNRFRLGCVANSASSSASASGGGGEGIGGSGGGGGGGEGASEGGESTKKPVVGGPEEVSAVSSDVIILDVGGMTCGGCAASVKRILEKQPQVSSASVNLATETAIVWPISEAKVASNWQKHIGETLAKHLTNCGFKSNLQVGEPGGTSDGPFGRSRPLFTFAQTSA